MALPQSQSHPLVVVLDLDGTIIGDIKPQIVSYEISSDIKAAGGTLTYKFKDLPVKLNAGIIRPFFADFIKKLKARVPNIEFFIYTASEKQWAQYIIKQVETACKIKFNRPLFTRENCVIVNNECRKSIKTIRPAIFKALKKKYGLKSAADLNDRIMVVDNMDVFNGSDIKYHIHCKTYDYKYPENIPFMFTPAEYAKFWQIIGNVVEKYYPTVKPTADFLQFQQHFYAQYSSFISKTFSANAHYLQDTFYKNLYKVMLYVIVDKNHRTFDASAIKYISKQLHHTRNAANHIKA